MVGMRYHCGLAAALHERVRSIYRRETEGRGNSYRIEPKSFAEDFKL